MAPSDHRRRSPLLVKRDPGQPIVFVGYVAMTIGILWLMGTRMTERRRRS